MIFWPEVIQISEELECVLSLGLWNKSGYAVDLITTPSSDSLERSTEE